LVVLLRLAYLGVTNAFAMLRLLPMSDRDKDTEILALRHQITVLQRQLGDQKVRLQPSGRCCVGGSTDALDHSRVPGQIAMDSSVNAAANRSAQGTSVASS
jgi:hypothetical protein